jgi:hypothetical protein
MANIFLRSPYYLTSSTSTASVELTIQINGADRYTIIKNNSTFDPLNPVLNTITFEVAELIRDYLSIVYSKPINAAVGNVYGVLTLKTYDAIDAGGSLVSTTTENYLGIDGYGYFEEGYNPTTTRGYMQSNDVIYKFDDADLRVPIDRNNTTSVSYLYKGEVIKTEAITGNAQQVFQYIQTSSGGVDSFKDRVLDDGGTYESSQCIIKFLDKYDIYGVDEVQLSTTDGLRTLKVITISECRFKPAKISFVNRYGAIQDLWFFKKTIDKLKTTRESFKSSAGLNYNTLEHQNKDYNVQSTKSITINSGYVSEDYNAPMQELLQSEQVWMEIDNIITPMNVKDSGMTFKTSVNDRLVDYKLELDYAYNAINNIR